MFSELNRGQGGWSEERREWEGMGQTDKGDAGWGQSRSDHLLTAFVKDCSFLL